MSSSLRALLETRLGAALQLTAVSGGDINQCFEARAGDGRVWFVKTHASPLPGMYRCEAEGLRWLAAARALRVPEVVFACDPEGGAPGCLVLEHIARGRRAADYDERLGAGLAALHASGAPRFGLERDNYLATLPQDNRASPSWAAFYAQRRIAPQVERAARGGLLDARLVGRLEALMARFPELLGPDEPPARLHGELWGGNAMCDEHGAPVLIDPAVYGGSREIDLAMMRLFGGFGERVFEAYHAAYPLAPGQRERVPLYQLYPLLVHVNLFGSGYVGQVAHAIDRFA
jgi:fructosamine-3-kinase